MGHVTGLSQVFTSSMRCSRELLQASRHRRVRLLAAFLALAPFALVLADARPPALLALAPPALVLADARPPALLALSPLALVRTETARLLVRCASRCVGLSEPPPPARSAAAYRQLCRRGALVTGSGFRARARWTLFHPHMLAGPNE